MKDVLNGRRPQWKTTSIEDDLNGRRPQWKTTLMEDDLFLKWKTTSIFVKILDDLIFSLNGRRRQII